MRDFRIKSAPLREAIEKARQAGALENGSDDDDDADEITDEDVDFNSQALAADASDEASLGQPVAEVNLSGSTTTSGGSMIRELEMDASARTTVRRNVAAINKRVEKRKQMEPDDVDDVVVENQRKRKKSAPSTSTATGAERQRRSSRRKATDDE